MPPTFLIELITSISWVFLPLSSVLLRLRYMRPTGGRSCVRAIVLLPCTDVEYVIYYSSAVRSRVVLVSEQERVEDSAYVRVGTASRSKM